MSSQQTNVLVTGANGLIGNLVYAHLATMPERYLPFGNARRREPSARVTGAIYTPIPDDRLRIADLMDFDKMRRAIEGMDVVVHMAADASGHSGYKSVLKNNIIGARNVFEASRLAGVKRVIFASTNQVVFGYRDTEPYKSLFELRFDDVDPKAIEPIAHDQPARPLNDYAASKVYGEMLAHQYAFAHGMSCIALRVGWVTHDDELPHPAARFLWCSKRDIVQIVMRCIEAPASLRFDVFFGQSNNPYNLVDIEHPRRVLGYEPQDNVEDHWREFKDAKPW
jgi:nucleoside-diphosphate-sugar epimerase